VAAHGGTTEKFIGDAVMAVFGLPQAHGDDVLRALSAALELRDRVPVRLGVSTGEVVATRDTSGGDFLITGDAVNIAARLQQAADVGDFVQRTRRTRRRRGIRLWTRHRDRREGQVDPDPGRHAGGARRRPHAGPDPFRRPRG
jgi:class 3 adenylate cyclase